MRRYEGDKVVLIAVADLLSPTDLVSKVRGFVLSPKRIDDIDDLHQESSDDFEAASVKAAAAATALGEAAAADSAALGTLLADLLHTNRGRVADFGVGLARATDRPRELWGEIARQMAATSPSNVQLLWGFTRGLHHRDAVLANVLLDDAFDLPALARWIPYLQTAVGLDSLGLARLRRAIECGTSPSSYFSALATGRVCDDVPGRDFADLVLALADMPDGNAVALDILGMRLFTCKIDKRTPQPEVIAVSKALLTAYAFRPRAQLHQGEENDLDHLVRASLGSEDGVPIARRLIRNLADAVDDHRVSGLGYTGLVTALLHTQPHATLDELFAGDDLRQRTGFRLLRELRHTPKEPMSSVSDDVLIAWCEDDPVTRYPIAAAIAVVFHRPASDGPEEWMPLARRLLSAAVDPVPVMNAMLQRLRPNGWSGSLASILESRLVLLEHLDISGLPSLSAPHEAGREYLRRAIASERAREADESHRQPTTFE